jgi:acyl-CoA thioester hydrolase
LSGERCAGPVAADRPFGHINNAVISTFLESGRSELLRHKGADVAAADCRFVLVRSEIDFLGELHFPGDVIVGSAVARIGRTSLTFEQAIYQHDVCRAVSRSVVVHAHAMQKVSCELTTEARTHFERLGPVAEKELTGR